MTGVLIAQSRGELSDRVRQQLEIMGSGNGDDADVWLAERRSRWIIGTLDEAGERLRAFADAGAERIMLQDFMPRDLDMIQLMARLRD